MSYPGGKAKTFHHIVNLIPPHRVYIEPFMGRGSVLRAKRPSDIEIGIDLDSRLTHCPDLTARGVVLINGDGIEYLQKNRFHGDEVIYCDPPYYPCSRRRVRVYKYDTSINDHIRLLDHITTTDARVILSGYDNNLYREALEHWNTYRYFAKAHDGVREETLWYNFPTPETLHDYRYLGSTYRERQTIKRKLHRLEQRINGLSPQEKAYILQRLSRRGSEYAD